MGKSGGRLVVRDARMVRQPGDGSCLFHSLCYGLKLNGGGRGQEAKQLRQDPARFIAKNPQLEISGDTLEEWIKWTRKPQCETTQTEWQLLAGAEASRWPLAPS